MSAPHVRAATPMTIGTLSRRTGVPVKALRTYEDLGLIASIGRSPGNYRLFGEEALWCVAVVEELRGLGLTLAEITELSEPYLHDAVPLGPRVTAVLEAARARTRERIDTLQSRLERLDRFEEDHVEELAGRADFRSDDPCLGGKGLDSPTGGRS